MGRFLLRLIDFAWENGADDYLVLTRSWIEAHPTPRSSR
jgi:hypothetical protein